MIQQKTSRDQGQLLVLDLCGYQSSLMFEYPSRKELLESPPSYFAERQLTKIEWSLDSMKHITALRVTFTNKNGNIFTSPIFAQPNTLQNVSKIPKI